MAKVRSRICSLCVCLEFGGSSCDDGDVTYSRCSAVSSLTAKQDSATECPSLLVCLGFFFLLINKANVAEKPLPGPLVPERW